MNRLSRIYNESKIAIGSNERFVVVIRVSFETDISFFENNAFERARV